MGVKTFKEPNTVFVADATLGQRVVLRGEGFQIACRPYFVGDYNRPNLIMCQVTDESGKGITSLQISSLHAEILVQSLDHLMRITNQAQRIYGRVVGPISISTGKTKQITYGPDFFAAFVTRNIGEK